MNAPDGDLLDDALIQLEIAADFPDGSRAPACEAFVLLGRAIGIPHGELRKLVNALSCDHRQTIDDPGRMTCMQCGKTWPKDAPQPAREVRKA